MTSVELCPKCHVSIALTSHPLSFGEDFAEAYRNPTETEVSYIASNLENVSSEMADLGQEIARVESILIALKAHHTHLDRYIQRNTQYIRPSSVRRLPTETLEIIFASACTSFERNEYKTPLSISLVCSKWRDIALSIPSLWTHIYVAPHSGGLDVYNHFLELCGNIPISVKVDIPYRDRPLASEFDHDNIPYEETFDYHTEVLAAIGQNSAQWQVAELRMNQEDINLLEYDIYGLHCPVLESLTLVNDGPLTYLKTDSFNQASSLTSFTVLDSGGNEVRCRFYADALPWSQLREVCVQSDVHPLSVQLNKNKLDNGTNRTLVFRPHLYFMHLPFNVQFSLPVSTLILDSVVWSNSFSEFFKAVTIPTLQSLVMMPPDPSATRAHYVPAEWTNPFSALPEFLNRSGCGLQVFTVKMRGRYDEGAYGFATMQPTLADSLISALHCMADLRTLCIIEAESGPSLFSERLFQEMAEGHLLPELTSLELVWAEERRPADILLAMLNTRCGQGSAGIDNLSSVVLGVRNGGDLRGDVLDCMSNLRQQGIRATLW